MYHKAAEQGHIEAKVSLDRIIAKGPVVSEYDAKAVPWYRVAAEVGHTESQYKLALMYFTGMVEPEFHFSAERLLRNAAKQGHVKAQYKLGVLYQNRSYKEKKKAARWFSKAANQGHTKAKNRLELINMIRIYGEPKLPKSDAKIQRCFRKAIGQNDSQSQYVLGLMYGLGEGVHEDEAQSLRWYRKAAEQGHIKAQYSYASSIQLNMYKIDSEDKELEAAREVEHWYRKAAEQGHPYAQTELGNVYLENVDDDGDEGNRIFKDNAEALPWFHKAAEQGDTDAHIAIGRMYEDGNGVPQDKTEATKWYLLAAELGDGEAQAYLGSSYHDGNGVPQDNLQAYAWLIASEASNAVGGRTLVEALKDKIIKDMTPVKVTEAKKLSFEYW